MIKYTIYTENKNIKKIEAILNNNIIIKGYTIIKSIGYWQGLKEQSLKIEVLLPKHYNYQIKTIGQRIKRLNKQEAVYLTIEAVNTAII